MLEQLGEAVAKWWWQIEEGMPAEIADGRLLMSERPVWTAYPVPLYGIPDQVYATPDRAIVPVDTKTRCKPSVSVRDIVQLSVYRAIFTYTDHPLFRRRPTRPYGYLRFAWNGRAKYVRVQLYATEVVMNLSIGYLRASRMRRPTHALGRPLLDQCEPVWFAHGF